jgi:dTDP-4-amino-4,6-dideoxygalactose transaminase
VNDAKLAERAEIIREKGTNRSQFFRGQVDKYTWVDIGSSFLPSELIAAFLWAQMEEAEDLTRRRLEIWRRYHSAFSYLQERGYVRQPVVPAACEHNAHMYYLLLPHLEKRTEFISAMKAAGIATVFHYVPLHDSPAGLRYGRSRGDLPVTLDASERLVRLPLWLGMEGELDGIIGKVIEAAQ